MMSLPSRRCVARGLGCPQRGAGQRPASTRPHASYPHPYALTLRIRFKLTASPIVSSSTETRCRRRLCQLNMVVAFALRRPPSLSCKVPYVLRRLAPAPVLQARTPPSASCFCLGTRVMLRVRVLLVHKEKETDSPFVEMHISRDRVPCERAVSVTLIVEREHVGPAV